MNDLLNQALSDWKAAIHYQETVASFAAWLRSRGGVVHERDNSVLERVGRKGNRVVYRIWVFTVDGDAEAQMPLIWGLPVAMEG